MATSPPDDPFDIKAYGGAPGDFRIGLAPIAPAFWLEGQEDDPAPRKDALMACAPADVWGEMDGSWAGQAEALDLIQTWLRVDAPDDGGRSPLLTAARLVEDDLCLMEKRGGHWTLTAASLCSGSFFTPAEAVGKALHELHGPVPGFNERFLLRVARIFDHLAADAVLERRNWTVVNSGDLSLPRAAPVRARIDGIAPDQAASALYLRSERQTLRRLPQTGGVIFTIRVWREALGVILADPRRRGAFKAAWEEAMTQPGGAMRGYKRFDALDHLVRALIG
jgi:hypothetical protein